MIYNILVFQMWPFWSFLLAISALVLPSRVSGSVDPYDFSKLPQCNFTAAAEQRDVPKLARKFTIKVEGKPDPKGFFDSDGFYDADNDQGTTFILKEGKRSGYYYDFQTGKAFNVISKLEYFTQMNKCFYFYYF